MSANPFSDCYASSESDSSPYEERTSKNDTKTIAFRDTIPVPSLKAIRPTCAPRSAFSASSSSGESSTSSPTSPSPQAKIEWTNANLDSLLSALYCDQVVANSLFFDPPLETLHKSTYPVRLHLYLRLPPTPVPTSAYSPKAPIGTGRPTTKKLLISTPPCPSASAVRHSLAALLLGDGSTLRYMIAYYSLMVDLFRLPRPTLDSVYRGMKCMAKASEPEWYERLAQVSDAKVDKSWEFEVRLEAFLLQAGVWEVERWVGAVEYAIWVGESGREDVARVYVEVGKFLEGALRGL